MKPVLQILRKDMENVAMSGAAIEAAYAEYWELQSDHDLKFTNSIGELTEKWGKRVLAEVLKVSVVSLDYENFNCPACEKLIFVKSRSAFNKLYKGLDKAIDKCRHPQHKSNCRLLYNAMIHKLHLVHRRTDISNSFNARDIPTKDYFRLYTAYENGWISNKHSIESHASDNSIIWNWLPAFIDAGYVSFYKEEFQIPKRVQSLVKLILDMRKEYRYFDDEIPDVGFWFEYFTQPLPPGHYFNLQDGLAISNLNREIFGYQIYCAKDSLECVDDYLEDVMDARISSLTKFINDLTDNNNIPVENTSSQHNILIEKLVSKLSVCHAIDLICLVAEQCMIFERSPGINRVARFATFYFGLARYLGDLLDQKVAPPPSAIEHYEDYSSEIEVVISKIFLNGKDSRLLSLEELKSAMVGKIEYVKVHGPD